MVLGFFIYPVGAPSARRPSFPSLPMLLGLLVNTKGVGKEGGSSEHRGERREHTEMQTADKFGHTWMSKSFGYRGSQGVLVELQGRW